MPVTTTKGLKDALDLGLGIVTRIWDYKTKDWATSVFAEDIDNDGNTEIIACTRDGRIHALSPKGTDFQFHWRRIIGTKAWVGTAIAGITPPRQMNTPYCITVGTRDGKVYMLDKDGQTVSRDGKTFPYDEETGWAIDRENELEACWFDTAGHAIRQIAFDEQSSTILIASEDRYIYGLNYATGEVKWRYRTRGWVRTVTSCDIDGDGRNEVLAGSVDSSLYVLNQQGQMLDRHNMQSPIYTIVATDVDRDGCVELLVTTEDKDLTALTYHRPQGNEHGCFEQKWRKIFDNRILSFCVADFDEDGNNEIVAGSEDKHLYILDASANILWRHNHKFRVFSLFPYDIDNNGLPELLLGTENKRVRSMRITLKRDAWKKIRRLYHQSQTSHATESSELSKLTADQHVLLQDILQTGSRETVTLQQGQILLTEKKYAQALSTFLQLEQQKVEQQWQKKMPGKVRSISLRHVASEQKQEIIVGTYEGTVHALHASGKQLWSMPLNEHILEVQTGFIGHHRQEEIVTSTEAHRVYVLSGTKKSELPDTPLNDASISSICVIAPDRHSNPEIIISSESRNLSIYSGDMLSPTETIAIKEGVRIVRAITLAEGSGPEIFVASLTNHVFAYTRNVFASARNGRQQRQPLWEYRTRDRIKAMCIKDINNDGKVEVLVGSEDRNMYVLDNAGKLLWRYYLPHSILAIDVIDGDGRIFVGCADGFLYVFNKEGDLLWRYETQDRIRALRVGDIDADGNIEIIIGPEEELELLRIVNSRMLGTLIAQCWSELRRHTTSREAINALLTVSDPFLQAFALQKLVEQEDRTAGDFDMLEQALHANSIEVQKAAIHAVMTLYPLDPSRARLLLSQLWLDSEQEIRNSVIEHIHILLTQNWELSFHYLQLAAENFDRFGRRMVVRKLHQLIDSSVEKPMDRPGKIFRLLLTLAQDGESEWVRQETARTLAHFLNRDYGNLIVYMHLFIVKGLHRSVLQLIENAATIPVVKRFVHAVISMLKDLQESNIVEQLQLVILALGAASNLIYGKDLLLIYTELLRIFTLESLADIANYQCELKESQFNDRNKYAPIMVQVFERLSTINRPLKMYVRRENVHDRLASLLEAIKIIEGLTIFLEEKYATSLIGEPITRLPDHHVFILLLEKWRRLVMIQLNELRGNAELEVELQPQEAHKEAQVSIWFTVRNVGRSSASDVTVTLMHSEHFEIVGNNAFETETIAPQEEIVPEFTLKPQCDCGTLQLQFEILYNDIDGQLKIEDFADILTLRETSQEFRDIPNPYSSGVPMHDRKMFYGREKDMAYLRDNLTRDARSVVVLYGQRRSGKTTVLLQFINSSPDWDAIPVLIDMQGVSYEVAIDTLLHGIAYAIEQSMAQKDLLVSAPVLENFTANPLHTFRLFLNEVEKQLAGRKLILLIDEFEVLEEQVNMKKLKPEIFEYLRDIVQHRPSINFLFAGTHKITEHTKWYRSVFFNIALHHQLLRLSTEGAEALIQRPVEGFLTYEPQALKKIHMLTGDQPYLIHLMCRAIVDYCNEREKTFVTINDVNTVQRDVMRTGQFHFDWLWDQIKPEVRVALAAIAEGGREEGRWLSFSELREIYRHHEIYFKREHMLETMKTLIEADIIEKIQGDIRRDTLESNRFRIPVGLTRNWLLKEHPLELALLEMSD